VPGPSHEHLAASADVPGRRRRSRDCGIPDACGRRAIYAGVAEFVVVTVWPVAARQQRRGDPLASQAPVPNHPHDGNARCLRSDECELDDTDSGQECCSQFLPSAKQRRKRRIQFGDAMRLLHAAIV
jgi:hypothetical protein